MILRLFGAEPLTEAMIIRSNVAYVHKWSKCVDILHTDTPHGLNTKSNIDVI